MDTTTTTPSAHGWPIKCVNVNELLNTVTAEINAYEAKQLGKLKSELEAFEKKKQAVGDAYEQKYRALRDRWCRLTAELETLHRALVCVFKDEWKAHITACICPKLSEIAEAEAALQTRLTCSFGALEQARNEATAKTDQAKIYLDTLIGNQAALDKELAAIEKWTAEIKTLLPGKDAAKAIYLLWFKALPKQWDIASDELRKHLKFAEGQALDDLCPPKEPAGNNGAQTPHPVPWLVDPDDYPNEIDCAWTAYWSAKKGQGEAEVAFKNNPDDVATRTKQLEELRKTLDARIAECPKDAAPGPNCGCADPAEPEEPAAATGQKSSAQSGGQSDSQAPDAASSTETVQED